MRDMDRREREALDRWIERSDEDWDGGWHPPEDWTGAEWVEIRGDTIRLVTAVDTFLQLVISDCIEGRF